MTEQEKKEALCEVFETDRFTPETRLDTLNWDSMAMLSVIAVAKANGVAISGDAIRAFKTVGDVLEAL